MQLSIGDKLGPYEVLALLGAGGMGKVYRARDSRLHREVAIKVSDDQFTDMFRRETRAIASLNHPNICTLHDVGPNYLVMELVEGEMLSDRIKRGSLPLDAALAIARQIAEAIDAAHQQSVIHRDLKPANIMLKPDGSVKVLDFGLAKQHVLNASAEVAADSPTITITAIEAGVIAGTPAYMAPEQALGRPVDRRVDIWAFGVVLYEMLAGRKPFEARSVAETVYAVLGQEPEWERIPGSVQRLLKKCLEKEPRRRLRDIADAWELVEKAEANQKSVRLKLLPWGIAGLAIAIAGWTFLRLPSRPEQTLVRLDVDLGAEASLSGASTSSTVVISPDGSRLVYIARTAAGQSLFTRRLDQPLAAELPGTVGAIAPFFSPDGRWIGFYASNKLSKISLDNNAVVSLGTVPYVVGASWGEDGNIILGQAGYKGLARISSAGGVPEEVTRPMRGEFAHTLPQILPGGKAVLFAAYTAAEVVDEAHIDVVSLADRRRKVLVQGATSPLYLASGHLVYFKGGTLFAVPFDLKRLETRGTAVPVVDGIAYHLIGMGMFDVSVKGTLVYRPLARTKVQWVDTNTNSIQSESRLGRYSSLKFSPDGSRLAMLVTEGPRGDIWVSDEHGEAMTRLTFGGGSYSKPIWTPDGQFVVFGSLGSGILWTRADGSGEPLALTRSQMLQRPNSFTPDGKWLAYTQTESGGTGRTWILPVENHGGQLQAGRPNPLLSFDEANAIISPDGRWVAYLSNQSGRIEVYVRAFLKPKTGSGKWQVSEGGGGDSIWLQDGRELLYRQGGRIMAVSYRVVGDVFVPEKPRVWLEKLPGADFDVTRDGKRLAAVVPAEGPETYRTQHEVTFVENFFDELRRRVSVEK